MKALYTTLFLAVISFCVNAQHVYPEVYDNCYLDEFVFEEDKIIAEQTNERIIEVVTMGWDKKMLKNGVGFLGIQIHVDNRGKSCLMSVRNDTDMKLKKMNLEGNINNNLTWPTQSPKVSVILLMEFNEGEISVKRLGTTDMVNLVEIKE